MTASEESDSVDLKELEAWCSRERLGMPVIKQDVWDEFD